MNKIHQNTYNSVKYKVSVKIRNNAILNEIEVLLIRQMYSTIEISTCNFFNRVYSEVAKLVNGACYRCRFSNEVESPFSSYLCFVY